MSDAEAIGHRAYVTYARQWGLIVGVSYPYDGEADLALFEVRLDCGALATALPSQLAFE
jgi:hypothetical protein